MLKTSESGEGYTLYYYLFFVLLFQFSCMFEIITQF